MAKRNNGNGTAKPVMKVKVFGVDYSVHFLSPDLLLGFYYREQGENGVRDIERVVGAGGRSFGGLCDSARSRIFINTEMPEDKQAKVLCHELVEAFDQETCLGFKHPVIESVANFMHMSFGIGAQLMELRAMPVRSKSKRRGATPLRKAA